MKCTYCGKFTAKKDIVFSYDLDMNRFDWWVYEFKGGIKLNKLKLKPNYWYGYIGYIPLLNDLIYWLWEKLHTPKIFKIRECKKCSTLNKPNTHK